MRNRTLVPLICLLAFGATHKSVYAQAVHVPDALVGRVKVSLTKLESFITASKALRTSADDLIRDMLREMFRDRPSMTKDAIKDTLGSKFKSIDVQVVERLSLPRVLEEKGELAEDISVDVSIHDVSLRISSTFEQNIGLVYIEMTIQQAIFSEDMTKIERLIHENLAKELPEFSREYLKKRLDDAKAEAQQNLEKAQKDRDSIVAKREKLPTDKGLPADKAAEQLVEIDRQLLSERLSAAGLEARERAIKEHLKRLEKEVELAKVAIDKAEATARLEYLEKARKATTENIRIQQEARQLARQLAQTNNLIREYSDQLEKLNAVPEKIEPVEVVMEKSGSGIRNRRAFR